MNPPPAASRRKSATLPNLLKSPHLWVRCRLHWFRPIRSGTARSGGWEVLQSQNLSLKGPRNSTARTVRTANRFTRRLQFEQLEDRRVLATFTVTNLSDAAVAFPGNAPGTLRQAVYDANHTAGADVIQFASNVSGTVNLSIVDDNSLGASSLVISSPITIRGNAIGITIGRNTSGSEMRLFKVTAAGSLTLDSRSVTGGVIRGIN